MEQMEKLLEAARQSRLVIFAGAGVSVGAPTNLPSWRDVNRMVVRSLAATAAGSVGEAMSTRAADLILARHAQEKLPPEYQAQVLAEFLHARYFEVLRHLDSDRPNPTHLAIAWLARLGCVRAIITTNFDRVIEAAFLDVGVPLERCFQPEHFETLAADPARLETPGGPCHLLKLHGSVDDPKTLIDTLAQRKKGFPAPVMDCVRHLLHSSHWLFLGFSGLDLEAEPNYLALAQEADRAAGFTWFVRANTEPKPAVVRLKNLYGERGGWVEGNLPDWLLDFTAALSPESRAWIDSRAAARGSTGGKPATFPLEQGAAKWANDLTPNVCALALAFVVIACAEPQTAAELVERVLGTIEARPSANASPGKGFLALKSVAANALGNLLAGLGRHEEAVRWFNTAVGLAENAGDGDTRDRFRGNLAYSLETLGRVDEAHRLYQTAIEGYRHRGDPVTLAFGLGALASHLIRQFRLDEARACAEEAVQWAIKAGDERLRGTALHDLGMIAKHQKDYGEALKVFAEVEAVFARLGNDEAVAAAAGNRGEVLASLGQFAEAEQIQKEVLQTNERLERRENQAATCLNLGTLAQQRGDMAGAEAWFNRALEMSRLIKDPSNQAFALLRLSGIMMETDRFEEAAAVAKSALPLATQRNEAIISDLWNQIGLANFRLGYVGRAEEAYRKVRDFARDRGLSKTLASATMNLGTALLLQQRNDEAAAFFDEAAAGWAKLEDIGNYEYCTLGAAAVRLDQRIAALSDAGHAAPDPGQQRAAAREMVTLYPDLIAMYDRIGAQQLVAEFCSSAASTAAFAGEPDKATAWYRQAAEVFRNIGLPPRSRQSLERCEDLLRRRANALMRSPDAAALPVLLQLAEVAGELGHRENCATSLLNAAIVLVQTSQRFAEARGLAEQALGLFAGDSDDAATARKVIAWCDEQLKTQPG